MIERVQTHAPQVPGGGIAGGGGIGMELLSLGIQQLAEGFGDGRGRRHIGIADAEIKHILLADLPSSDGSVFGNIPDDGIIISKGKHRL